MSDERTKHSAVTVILAVCAAAVLACIALWAYDASELMIGDGHADLDIEFLVTDAANAEPIPGARIDIERVVYDFSKRRIETLRTDSAGETHYLCPDSWTSSRTSRLRFTDTRHVHPPEIILRVLADGYEPAEWGNLGTEFGRNVESIWIDEKDRFPVRIELKKAVAAK